MILVAVGFLVGLMFGAPLFGLWHLRASRPKPPRCAAVLQSGHECRYEAGHEGPHKTVIHASGFDLESQEYVWEDPKNGVASVGFFRR